MTNSEFTMIFFESIYIVRVRYHHYKTVTEPLHNSACQDGVWKLALFMLAIYPVYVLFRLAVLVNPLFKAAGGRNKLVEGGR